MNLIAVPAFKDNYIWILADSTGQCVIIDPGDAQPVLTRLSTLAPSLQPIAILLTHYHADHTAGVAELLAYYPQLAVFGPEETRVKGAQHIVRGGDIVTVSNFQFTVMAVPGHTSDHVAYYHSPYLFCGDVLFSAGCGRLFDSSCAGQMYHSLQQIAQLPDDTQICCAHEYTLANLKFALSILPQDSVIKAHYTEVSRLRQQQQSSLPSLLKTERLINLFLRCDDLLLKNAIYSSQLQTQPIQVFAELRRKKDRF